MRLVRDREEEDIQLEGRLVRFDRVGAPTEIARFAAVGEARVHYDDEIAARLGEGFVEAPDPVVDREARLVYADELQLRGDPVGELIAIHHELERGGERARQVKRMENRAAELLERHHEAWFGSLARFVHKPSRKGPAVPAVRVAWRLGFAEEVHLQGSEQLAIEVAYARLRELPLSRQIRKLVVGSPLGPVADDDGAEPRVAYAAAAAHGRSYAALCYAMLEHGIPSRLRELVLGQDLAHRRPTLDLGPVRLVIEAATALEVLRIVGGHAGVSLVSAQLRGLEIGDVTAGDLHLLGQAELPRLEELVLRARAPIAAPELFAWFPRLTALTLEGFARTGRTRPLAEYLAEAAPPALRTLALPRCQLVDADLEAFVANAPRLAGLRKLDLRRNQIGAGAAAAARRALPGLRVA